MTSEQDARIESPLSERHRTRKNPPDQTALSYRACEYSDTLQRMLGRLPLVTVRAPDGKLSAPLARLNAQAGDDWTVGMLHAWAVATDVLSFYQERIVNEGFIRTAVERRSVMELVRMLGYEMRPGVAASTYLAFNVLEDEESPHRQIVVPAETAVQSVPDDDGLPQIFETSEALTAHVAWNEIPLTIGEGLPNSPQADPQPENSDQETTIVPEAKATPQDIDLTVTSMRIVGSELGLLPENRILLIRKDDDAPFAGAPPSSAPSAEEPPTDTPPTGEAPAAAASPSAEPATTEPATTEPAAEEPAAVEPAAVEPAAEESSADAPATAEPTTDATPEDAPFSDETAGIQSTTYHGRLAELDDVRSDAERGWTEISWKPFDEATPPVPIDSNEPGVYGFTQQTTLFSFQPTGIDYRAQGADTWSPGGIGLPTIPITAMVELPSGTLLAASEEDVHRSTNGGATWHAFPTGSILKKVRALAVGEAGDVYAGSDDGDVFRSVDGMEAWRLMSGGPPPPPPTTTKSIIAAIPWPGKTLKRLPEAPIRALAEYREGKKNLLVAGTDEGVFRSADKGQTWKSADRFTAKPKSGGAAKMPVTDTAVIQKEGSRSDKAVLATPAGVFSIGKTIRHRWVLTIAAIAFAALQYGFEFELPTALGKLPAVMAELGITLPKDPGDEDNPTGAESEAVPGDASEDDASQDDASKSDAMKGDATSQQPAGPPDESAEADGADTTQSIGNALHYVVDLIVDVLKILFIASVDEDATPKDSDEPADGEESEAEPNPVVGAMKSLVEKLPAPIKELIGKERLEKITAQLANLASVISMFYAGIFAYGRTRQAIQKRPGSSLGEPVKAVAVSGEGRLIAGTEKGIFRSIEPGGDADAALWRRVGGFLLKQIAGDAARRWKPVKEDVDISSLCVMADNAILAAGADGIVLLSTDHGSTWQPWNKRFRLTETVNLLAAEKGVFAAGTRIDGDAEPRWSSWQLREGQILLSEPAPNLEPKSWVLLTAEDRPQEMWFRQVDRISRTNSHDVARPGQLTTLHVSGLDQLVAWDLTRVSVWIGGEKLEPRRSTPVFGRTVRIANLPAQLRPGKNMFIRGQRMRARVRQDSSAAVELVRDKGQPIKLAHHQWLTILGPPSETDPKKSAADTATVETNPKVVPPESNTPPVRYFKVKTDTGDRGWLAERTISFEAARAKDPVVSELRTIDNLQHQAGAHDTGTTLLTFDKSLDKCYDFDTVVLHGNVAHATHGESVTGEVLGSSDGKTVFQQYWLRQTGADRGLTFVSAETPSGVQPTVSVTVNGIRWHQVPALDDAEPNERAFVLRQDDDGHSSIAFGDGHASARIPSNREEVMASYRLGIGRVGNVPAASLSTLVAGPAGVDEVFNPLDASGGVGREDIEQAKPRLALHTKSFGRLVSLTDFETFAANFGGVGRTSARLFHLGHRSLLHLSIADANGLPLPDESDILTKLSKAIERLRAVPEHTIQVSSYKPRFLQVAATLLIHPDWEDKHDQMKADARRVLGERFSYARMAFGQDVSISQVVSMLQSIDGVLAVRVNEFYLKGDEPPNDNRKDDAAPPDNMLVANLARLQAGPARGGTVAPAELILFSASDEDSLKLEWRTHA